MCAGNVVGSDSLSSPVTVLQESTGHFFLHSICYPILIFWAGIKAVEATFKLHGKFASDTSELNDDSFASSELDYDGSSYEYLSEKNREESSFSSLERILIGVLVALMILIIGLILVVYVV